MEELNRETLRAELNGLELRLVDRLTAALAQKADSSLVLQHDARIKDLEQSRASREHLQPDFSDLDKRVTGLERWRYALPGTAFLSALAAVATTVYAILH